MNPPHKHNLSLRTWFILHTLTLILPLFLSVTYVSHVLDENSTFSIELNKQVLRQTKSIRGVLQRTADVERKARLYRVLSDATTGKSYELESYEATRVSLKQELNDLLLSPLDNKLTLLINELAEKEAIINRQILSSEGHDSEKLIDSAFLGLREASNSLAREFENYVDQQSQLVIKQSKAIDGLFLSVGAALCIIALFSIGVLVKVIGRPVHLLNRVTHEMLAGNFERPIDIHGPKELCHLAQNLELLRIHSNSSSDQPHHAELAAPSPSPENTAS